MVKNNNYPLARFDQIAEMISERVDPAEAEVERYVGLEHLDPETLQIKRWGTPDDVKGTKLRFYEGDIIFGRRRAYQKKLAVANFKGICSAHAMVLRAKPDVCLPKFLPFFMTSEMFFERALAISVGSLSPTINWKTLAKQEFPLPPIPEQRRIAEILWAADEAVERQLLIQQSLEEMRFAIGNAVWGKNKIPQKIGILSNQNQWVKTTLGKSCIKIQDGTHFSPKSNGGDFMYVTSKNIKDGYLDLEDVGWISEEEHKDIYNRCDVVNGDLLLTKDGANTGNVAINHLEEPFSLLSSVALLRTNRDLLDTDYLFHYFRSPQGKSYVTSFMKGTAITRLTLVVIRGMKILLPPIKDQKIVAKKLNGIRSSFLDSQKNLEKLQQVRKALVNRLVGNNVQ